MKRFVFYTAVLVFTAQMVSAADAVRWDAQWIWSEGETSPKNYYLYARKTFELSGDAREALAHISADSRYKLYVNGHYIGRGIARCYPEWQYYDTHTIADYLQPGKNVIAVLFQCDIQLADGATEQIVSDRSWRMQRAVQWKGKERRSRIYGWIEIYDAREEITGWQEIDFDDSGWQRPVIVMHDGQSRPPIPPWTRLVPRDIPFMMEKEIFPQSIVETGETEDREVEQYDASGFLQTLSDAYEPLRHCRIEDPDNMLRRDGRVAVIVNPANQPYEDFSGIYDAYVLIDFGKEVIGYPRITLKGVEGGIVDFAYSERLIGGKVAPYMQKTKYVDRYIMKEGWQTWEQFGWKGFRYMQLVFRNLSGPVEVDAVSLNFSTYPVGDRGAFSCSDDLLTTIWGLGAYTDQLCMMDAFMDCPWREKRQWVGDARIEVLTNFAAFGDTALTRKFLIQTAQSQLPAGLTQMVAPTEGIGGDVQPGGVGRHIVDYCLHWICSTYEYYMFTGDGELVEQIYPNIRKALRWFEKFSGENKLLKDIEGWVFIDWTNVEKRGTVAALNGIYLETLMKAAVLAETAGDASDAGHYRRRAEDIRMALRRHMWEPDLRAYIDCIDEGYRSRSVSQHTNALALLHDIAEGRQIPFVLSVLTGNPNEIVQTNPFFSHFLLLALDHVDRNDLALGFIRDKWGAMVRAGATSIWEEWTQWGTYRYGYWLPRPRSQAHAWSTAPTHFLSTVILGIQPMEAGFAEYSIMPDPVDLEWARGVYPSIKGDIPVSWERPGQGGFSLSTTVPEGAICHAGIPKFVLARQEVLLNGAVVWKGGRRQISGDVIAATETEKRLVFTVEPGTYTFLGK